MPSVKTPTPSPPGWPDSLEFRAMPEALRQTGCWHAFEKGSLLFAIGEQPTKLFFIAQGEAYLRRVSPEGLEMIMQRARHSFLAEASLEAHTYHCDGVLAEPSWVLGFPIKTFNTALQTDAEFRAHWLSRLLRETRRARAQCERLGLRSAKARILHYLESESPDQALQLPHSKKAWAAELGLSHEALYRTLASLVRQGVIEVDGLCIFRTTPAHHSRTKKC